MIKFIKKNYLQLVGAFMFSLTYAIGNASAAVDSDLTSALASSTALVTDNKSTIITWFVGMISLVLVIKLAKAAIVKGMRMVVRAFKR